MGWLILFDLLKLNSVTGSGNVICRILVKTTKIEHSKSEILKINYLHFYFRQILLKIFQKVVLFDKANFVLPQN